MKNFLKKILGGSGEEEQKGDRQVQRSPRVRLPVLDPAVFVASNGKTYALRNLSESGLALVTEGERFPDKMSGEIVVAGDRAPAELIVVRRMGNEVGVSFAGDSMEVRGLLRRVFVDEFRAQGMTEVDPERQKAVPKGTPHWFYAPGNYELFYVEDQGTVIRFELEWNGNILTFVLGSGLRFGVIDRKPALEEDKVKHAQSSLVKWATEVKAEDRQKGARLLENIKGLESEPRAAMQKLLK